MLCIEFGSTREPVKLQDLNALSPTLSNEFDNVNFPVKPQSRNASSPMLCNESDNVNEPVNSQLLNAELPMLCRELGNVNCGLTLLIEFLNCVNALLLIVVKPSSRTRPFTSKLISAQGTGSAIAPLPDIVIIPVLESNDQLRFVPSPSPPQYPPTTFSSAFAGIPSINAAQIASSMTLIPVKRFIFTPHCYVFKNFTVVCIV